ncbi:hypothetical protein [Paenibacillus sp. N3.4]|uniref:hypothetical protein n=1 Tax=Paenibacillus sp. N3.4 TaxID=2603222 RepID=UPI00164F2815|nr:hypothetical protein [Paenibacillus sp. N3.4]
MSAAVSLTTNNRYYNASGAHCDINSAEQILAAERYSSVEGIYYLLQLVNAQDACKQGRLIMACCNQALTA